MIIHPKMTHLFEFGFHITYLYSQTIDVSKIYHALGISTVGSVEKTNLMVKLFGANNASKHDRSFLDV